MLDEDFNSSYSNRLVIYIFINIFLFLILCKQKFVNIHEKELFVTNSDFLATQ